ncbi:hypothetical protein D3C87_1378190 [compost metagenome]
MTTLGASGAFSSIFCASTIGALGTSTLGSSFTIGFGAVGVASLTTSGFFSTSFGVSAFTSGVSSFLGLDPLFKASKSILPTTFIPPVCVFDEFSFASEPVTFSTGFSFLSALDSSLVFTAAFFIKISFEATVSS